LVPPRGGVDWRAPPWLAEHIELRGLGKVSPKTDGYIRDFVMKESTSVSRVVMQDYNAGRYWYNEQILPGEASFETVFHEIWKTFFTPSPAVRERVETTMANAGLVPHNYTAAHCRVLYALDDRPENIKRAWAENAINCATELRPKTTIFFTSDSSNATYYAEQYGKQKGITISTHIPDPNPPLHIEFSGRRRPVSDYLDGFVDLYILAQADCVTYNKGGYGLMGLLMSRNATCGLRQDAMNRPRIHNPCHFVNDDPWNSTNENTRLHFVQKELLQHRNMPIYLEPMEDRIQTTDNELL